MNSGVYSRLISRVSDAVMPPPMIDPAMKASVNSQRRKRQPNRARLAFENSCTRACTGTIAVAGKKPGMIAISIMPPPIPVTAVSAEVAPAIRISRISLFK